MALEYGSGGNFTVTMEGPFGSAGSAVLIRQMDLPASGWKGAVSPFFQTVALEGITVRSKVDILPTHQQLEAFRSQELAFTTENNEGFLSVYAIGQRPEEDISFLAAITEVVV